MTIPYNLIRTRRKSIAIEIRPDLTICVRAPLHMPEAEIEAFVSTKQDWLRRNLIRIQEKQQALQELPGLTPAELRRLADEACRRLPPRVAYFAEQLGVTYGRITIRNQKTRWGSCSGKGNLNFNCLLMRAPERVTDYVIVHELCHRIEMNHSPAFWAHVERILPDYRVQRRWLREHGAELMAGRRFTEEAPG